MERQESWFQPLLKVVWKQYNKEVENNGLIEKGLYQGNGRESET